MMQSPMLDREDQDHNLIPGAWRTGYEMHNINRNLGGNTSKKRAKGQRDLLKLYYSDIGAMARYLKYYKMYFPLIYIA